ncbi:MAG: glycerol-3-phosphate 1-O-acyltransferase PlsY [Acidobacteria bacterium]|nr:glycerol-3-phosphate 1-O-acyltransferase PlsY [Acidobacteriota bacterium]
MEVVIAVAVGYVTGSVPFAFLLARRRGVDLRRRGSGNVGAANVLRTSGLGSGLAALTLDALKGALAVIIAQGLTASPAAPVAAGLASIVGHTYPVWLRFRGGKGVATAAGAFAVLAPLAALVAAGVFAVVVSITRYVSLGSIAAAVALPAAAGAGDAPEPVILGAFLTTLLVLHRHRANLARLVGGTEHRLGQRI